MFQFIGRVLARIRGWCKLQRAQRRATGRYDVLVKTLLASIDKPIKSIDWQEAGSSHIVAMVRARHFWNRRHHLCIIDLAFERLIAHQDLSRSVDHWSVEVKEGILAINVCHCLRSGWPEACSFWQFDPRDGQIKEDHGAKRRWLAEPD